jgi:hypothetical protein
MPVPKAKTRKERVEEVLREAEQGSPRPVEAPRKENPYPKGSARAKIWERQQEQDKKKKQ